MVCMEIQRESRWFFSTEVQVVERHQVRARFLCVLFCLFILDHARFFDPSKYNIILVDQRGCAKSTPYAEIRENNTQELVNDFEKLRKELKIEKWQLFGGSWGSLVALCYAVSVCTFCLAFLTALLQIQYPQHVTEMILRGVFLGRKAEVDWTFNGTGANYIFPKEWDDFISWIPENERDNLIDAYHRRLNGEFGEKGIVFLSLLLNLFFIIPRS
jgi:proline iminopeptidase